MPNEHATLEILGSVVYLDQDTENSDLSDRLSKRLSALVEGHEDDPRFQHGIWDGREKFLRYYGDGLGFPAGLLADALQFFESEGVSVSIRDKRKPVSPSLDVSFVGERIGKSPRDYQKQAVDEICKDRGALTASGLVVVPVRGGKTLISALAISRLRVKTLFVVPSKGLLAQTVRVFEELLEGVIIGQIGDGKWLPGDVTVATAQSLTKHVLKAFVLFKEIDLLIIDEGHHLGSAESWRNLVLKAPCRYKIGLTGTPPEKFSPKGASEESLWLEACTGPVLYRISMERLMDRGVLKSPHILLYPVYSIGPDTGPAPNSSGGRWAKLYKRGITENPARNEAIARLAHHAVELGLRVLIDVEKLDHLENIAAWLLHLEVPHSMVWGNSSMAERLAAEEALRKNTKPVIVGTVYGEGIDLPELEVVVVAGGMKSQKAAIQRLRNLTACEGKGEVAVVDFLDTRSPTLLSHSESREKVYRSRRGFQVQRIDFVPGDEYQFSSEIVEKIRRAT